ncbi:flagellar assembly factor FliW [Mariprofundus micogutta]|uniref:Flagellar assembly factor FliW n=1 Tax=Mariprofundus micogutta TaxID=1921010 RepID=A0A1L8CKK0_9PROT|nr:flagellar assembly protein FliW [Mariprofundus micogutta]GAV19437.1 flagellar assembly factor FliW [Mariprofundus micogutta]
MAATATETVMKPETQSDESFHFPQGIAGFTDAKEFGFIYQGHGDIVCIQSIDQPEASFLLTPWDEKRLGPAPSLPKDQHECMQIKDEKDLMWMLVLNPFVDKQWVTANLKAPIALNLEARLGLQCIRPDIELTDIRYNWMPQPETSD